MKITIIIDDEKCDVQVMKEQEIKKDISEANVSQYAKIFDENCSAWEDNKETNLVFLKCQELYATDRLKVLGHIFLNDVYDMLGFPRTKEGQIVGWIYDEKNPIGDNYVSFGLDADHNKEFVYGAKKTAILDFNVDGYIIDKI